MISLLAHTTGPLRNPSCAVVHPKQGVPSGGGEKETENHCVDETEKSYGPAPGKGGRDGQLRIDGEES